MSAYESRQVLVTGATGFVGRALVQRMSSEESLSPRLALHEAPPKPKELLHPYVITGDLASDIDWSACLQGCDAIVHCAARVHVMGEKAADPLTEFRRVNVEGTLNLARKAAEAGVQRFIYISSIKVNGEWTSTNRPFTADDVPAPVDSYAISKYEAEQSLLALAAGAGMEVVIIRPPLVYGPGVTANFLSMMRWLAKGVPLPLGAIHNKRTLVARSNLIDLIITCLNHPAAANQVFLAGDSEDLSTTELLRRMGKAMGKPVRLFPVSMNLLHTGASMLGKQTIFQRLCCSLRVDISKAQQRLGWQPPISVDKALQETVRAYRLDHGIDQ